MATIQKLKSISLAILIIASLGLQARPSLAAERQSLIVAGGCFWCVEADFESVPGVIEAVSGYTGGKIANPTYKQVTRGGTGHYEAVKITFDPAQVSRSALLHLFFRSVDPTDAGGQFCDRGESYRSAIFADGPDEKALATSARAEAQRALGQKIVTPILPQARFYEAEAYHQDYAKGRKIVLTRFGPKRQSAAYKAYRKACGRDARVRELWNSAAAFAGS